MTRFVDGVDRSQGLLLPDRLEDYVHEENPVRVVDAFVEALDLSALNRLGSFSDVSRKYCQQPDMGNVIAIERPPRPGHTQIQMIRHHHRER